MCILDDSGCKLGLTDGQHRQVKNLVRNFYLNVIILSSMAHVVTTGHRVSVYATDLLFFLHVSEHFK